MHTSDTGPPGAAARPPAGEPCRKRVVWWTALANPGAGGSPACPVRAPDGAGHAGVRRRRDLDAAGVTTVASARFTLGDPATDGLDFLLGGRLPQRWGARHGGRWHTLRSWLQRPPGPSP